MSVEGAEKLPQTQSPVGFRALNIRTVHRVDMRPLCLGDRMTLIRRGPVRLYYDPIYDYIDYMV